MRSSLRNLTKRTRAKETSDARAQSDPRGRGARVQTHGGGVPRGHRESREVAAEHEGFCNWVGGGFLTCKRHISTVRVDFLNPLSWPHGAAGPPKAPSVGTNDLPVVPHPPIAARSANMTPRSRARALQSVFDASPVLSSFWPVHRGAGLRCHVRLSGDDSSQMSSHLHLSGLLHRDQVSCLEALDESRLVIIAGAAQLSQSSRVCQKPSTTKKSTFIVLTF